MHTDSLYPLPLFHGYRLTYIDNKKKRRKKSEKGAKPKRKKCLEESARGKLNDKKQTGREDKKNTKMALVSRFASLKEGILEDASLGASLPRPNTPEILTRHSPTYHIYCSMKKSAFPVRNRCAIVT